MKGSLAGCTRSRPMTARTWLRAMSASARTSQRSPRPLWGRGQRRISRHSGGCQIDELAIKARVMGRSQACSLFRTWGAVEQPYRRVALQNDEELVKRCHEPLRARSKMKELCRQVRCDRDTGALTRLKEYPW